MSDHGVGIVTPQELTLFDAGDPLKLDSGLFFFPVNVRYEVYGMLNEQRSNAILVLHAFSGDAHAAGYHETAGDGSVDQRPGWWDEMIGPGRPIDTSTYCVICSNVIGGCQGTTGPGSTNPQTGRPYGLQFPVITIGDMVRVQKKLIDRLGIRKLLAVAGGSMGGMQALEWAVSYPEAVETALVLASTARLTAQGIAFNAVGRNAITSDPGWNNGCYYGEAPTKNGPSRGLAIARMVGHITYLSDESMRRKFGRQLQTGDSFSFDFNDQFKVESYLEHQGEKFVDRFDANSYLYLTKAMDYFDLGERFGGLQTAFRGAQCSFLVVAFTSDWLYPIYQSKELVFALIGAGKEVSYVELDSPYGHDSFLLETGRLGIVISSHLSTAAARRRSESVVDGRRSPEEEQ